MQHPQIDIDSDEQLLRSYMQLLEVKSLSSPEEIQSILSDVQEAFEKAVQAIQAQNSHRDQQATASEVQQPPTQTNNHYSAFVESPASPAVASRSWSWTHWTLALLAVGLLSTGSIILYRLSAVLPPRAQTAAPASSASPTLNAVAALGYVEPEGEIIVLSAPQGLEGARIEQIYVKHGDRVKVGQVLAVLDSRDRRQAALEQAKVQVNIALARLEQVKAGAKQGDIQAQNAKFQQTQAELKGQIAVQRAMIARWQAQLRGEQITQTAIVDNIQAQLQNAQAECIRYQTLHQNGAISAQEWERVCLQQTTTQERFKQAQATLQQTSSTLTEQIDEAKANLERTMATLQQQIQAEQSTLAAISEVRPVDVQLAQAELEESKAAVKKAQAELNLAYLRGPKAGRVLKIHTHQGEVVTQAGILEIGQTDQMYVTAQVYETDINRIDIDQNVTIRSDGIVRDLKGKVAEIGLKIGKKDILDTDPVADADARVVEVKVRLTPEASRQVAGLTNLQVHVIIDTSSTQSNHP